MMHLVFDLDGTLVDHRGRTYGLHVEYCKSRSLIPVAADEYHARKAAGASERKTVRDSIPADQMDAYMEWKRSRIETDEALAQDTPWPDVVALLAQLRGRATLVLLTSRQFESQVVKELERIGVARHFSSILAEPSDGSSTAKVAALGRYLTQAAVDPKRVIIIGDTECEIAAARALGASCISVTWGVRGESFLSARAPDGIAHSAAELDRILSERLPLRAQ